MATVAKPKKNISGEPGIANIKWPIMIQIAPYQMAFF